MSDRKRFQVIPGSMRSQNDKQEPWIGAGKLMQLYGVDPAECCAGEVRSAAEVSADGYVRTGQEGDWPTIVTRVPGFIIPERT